MKILIWIIFLTLSLNTLAARSLHSYGDGIRNAKAGWSEEFQGMCHDENNIYMVQRDYIWKIPRHIKLEKVKNTDSSKGIIKAGIPSFLKSTGSDHMGDCDVHQQFIYIPLEGSRPHKMLILQTETMEFISAPALPFQQTNAPWVTVDVDNGLIYTGVFNIPGKLGMSVFKLSADQKSLIHLGQKQFLNSNGTPMNLDRVQGVELNKSQNLFWVVSDKEEKGLYGFDATSMKLKFHKKIKFSKGFPKYEELEGIDSLESYERPLENYRGNIFVCMLDNNLGLFGDYGFLKLFELR